ncbi:MAG: DUF4173 domain-containing protein [Actinomycetota bacterium]|nr:DUF4173 domain-containing protein [Actinomycetota bacterium]
MSERLDRGDLFSLLVCVAGLLAAATLPGEPPGIAFVITSLLVLGSVWMLRGKDLRGADLSLLAAAGICVSFFALRTAGWLLGLNLVAALAVAAIGAARARGWRQMAVAPLRLAARLCPGVALVLRPVSRCLATVPDRSRASLARAGVLSAALALIYGVLFTSADAAFASLTQRLLVPDVDVRLLPVRVVVAVVCFAVAGAFVLLAASANEERASSPWKPDPPKRQRLRLAPAEWVTCLVVVDALFAAFVWVQLTVLFGGHSQVLETTGLTYAQYARSGFFQLVVVALITLALIAAAVNLGASTERTRFWMKLLLGVLCVLTLVVLASALRRMNLYQEAYGFTRLRLLVDTTILWLAGVFASLLVAGAVWNAAWLPRWVLGLAWFSLIVLNLLNPDALIASRNIDRFSRTGRVDSSYLSGLGLDAVPALTRLPEPERECALRAIGLRAGDGSSAWSWNFGRERALDLLEPYRHRLSVVPTGCVDS